MLPLQLLKPVLALLILIFSVLFGLVYAKDMNQEEIHYNLALYSISILESVPTLCDESAIDDPNTEWICAYYPNGYEAFINAWEEIANSQIVQENYALIPFTDWMYFDETDGTVDFYAKAYELGDVQLIVAYDPSEQGREVFIGVGSLVKAVMDTASGSLGITPVVNVSESQGISNLNDSVPNIQPDIGSYNCDDFLSQDEAIAFFKERGFSATYDPYRLDADDNGIPCEQPGETMEDSSLCFVGEYWVDPYTRKDGANVRGHCRKRR